MPWSGMAWQIQTTQPRRPQSFQHKLAVAYADTLLSKGLHNPPWSRLDTNPICLWDVLFLVADPMARKDLYIYIIVSKIIQGCLCA